MYAQNLELIEKGTCPMSFYLIKQDPNSNCSKASVSGAQDCDPYGADVLLCHLSVAFEFSFSEKDWSMHSTWRCKSNHRNIVFVCFGVVKCDSLMIFRNRPAGKSPCLNPMLLYAGGETFGRPRKGQGLTEKSPHVPILPTGQKGFSLDSRHQCLKALTSNFLKSF